MGKAKTISLTNGRTWPKEGDAVEHFKLMLARYRDGARVSDASDRSDLSALLEVYDSVVDEGQLTKAGAGVSHFERRKDQDHPGNTSCFFVVRIDGTSIGRERRRRLTIEQFVRLVQPSFGCCAEPWGRDIQ